MTDYKGVMVLGEVADGKVEAITAELLGAGRSLADALGEELSGVLLGSNIAGLSKDLIAFGANKVYTVDDPLLKEYQTDAYVTVIQRVCHEVKPSILLIGQTIIGRDLAPRLAFRLETGLATDCVELHIDPASKLLVQTHPCYGGNARAHIVCPTARPQMATVRAKTMTPLERNDSRTGSVIPLQANIDQSALKTKVLNRVKEEAAGIRLEDAQVIVSGGRGMGGAEGFKHLEELAKIVKGAVGASRAACDAGYAPASVQIGLTGKIVAPNLYIAVAISGASQHMAGCSGSKVIVAVNKDSEANIFKESRYGVVGDYRQVLPAFIEMCRELVGA